jgi:hypothetical protein
MSLDGLDLLDNKDVATWLSRLPRRIADLGPAVILIDHVTKSREGRDRWAIGAQHKLAGIDGAAYTIDAVHPLAHLASDTLEPVTGVSKITIAKDRPGGVRGFAAGNKHVGTLQLTAYPDGGITGHIVPAAELKEGGIRPTHNMERVSKALEQAKTPLGKKALRAATKLNWDSLELALALLAAEGFVVVESGAHNSVLHRVGRMYRAKDDTGGEIDEQEEAC